MSHHYPSLPVHLLHFNVNEDTFNNGREVMELFWPFLEKYRADCFKVSDLAQFYNLSGDDLYQMHNYLLQENLIYFSTPHSNFGSWKSNITSRDEVELPESSIHKDNNPLDRLTVDDSDEVAEVVSFDIS